MKLVFFIFYSFFSKQVKVLHESNIQKKCNIDILIYIVKKSSQTKKKNSLHIKYLVMHTDTKWPYRYHCRLQIIMPLNFQKEHQIFERKLVLCLDLCGKDGH